LLDGRTEPAAALALPHAGNRNGATEVESGRGSEDVVRELEKRGHAVQQVDMTSGLHLIVRVGERWVGAADPRREGVARGE
jgi:gamma-glutamyltranspeptidase/glutathione hydrolase